MHAVHEVFQQAKGRPLCTRTYMLDKDTSEHNGVAAVVICRAHSAVGQVLNAVRAAGPAAGSIAEPLPELTLTAADLLGASNASVHEPTMQPSAFRSSAPVSAGLSAAPVAVKAAEAFVDRGQQRAILRRSAQLGSTTACEQLQQLPQAEPPDQAAFHEVGSIEAEDCLILQEL